MARINTYRIGRRMKVDDALLARARRMATRTRAGAACVPCKFKKAKCNDYRPCKRCLDSGSDLCTDGGSARSISPGFLESGQDLSKDSSPAANSNLSPSQLPRVCTDFTAMKKAGDDGAVFSDLDWEGAFHSSRHPQTGYAADVYPGLAGTDSRSGASERNIWTAQSTRPVRWQLTACTNSYATMWAIQSINFA